MLDGDGSQLEDWATPDNTLSIAADGKVRPAVALSDVWLSAGNPAGGVIAYSKADGDAAPVTFEWPGAIPAPTLDGARATYPDVYPGVDFLIEVGINGGFETYFVIRDSAALAYLNSLTFDVEIAGTSVEATEDGGFSLVDDQGVALAHFPTARAWDAAEDVKQPRQVLAPYDREVHLSPGLQLGMLGLGDEIEVATRGLEMPVEIPVPLTVTQDGDTVTVALEPDAQWASSPDRTFPLVFDPYFGAGESWYDGYVRRDYPTTSFLNADELFVGTWDSGNAQYYSYINFRTGDVLAKDITKAELWIYDHHSWSCTKSGWKVYESDNNDSDVTYNHFVNHLSDLTFIDEFSDAKGNSSSCSAGYIKADSPRVTAMVQGWADGDDPGRGVWLWATDSTDNYSWKRFYSRDYYDSGKHPKIKYWSNEPPHEPTPFLVAGQTTPGVTEAPGPGSVVVDVEVSDPEGGRVRASFDIYETREYSSGAEFEVLVASAVPGGWTASGGPSGLDISRFLQGGLKYRVVAWGDDGRRRSDTSLTVLTAYPAPAWVGRANVTDIPDDCDTYNGNAILPTIGTLNPVQPTPTPCVSAEGSTS